MMAVVKSGTKRWLAYLPTYLPTYFPLGKRSTSDTLLSLLLLFFCWCHEIRFRPSIFVDSNIHPPTTFFFGFPLLPLHLPRREFPPLTHIHPLSLYPSPRSTSPIIFPKQRSFLNPPPPYHNLKLSMYLLYHPIPIPYRRSTPLSCPRVPAPPWGRGGERVKVERWRGWECKGGRRGRGKVRKREKEKKEER